MSKSVYTWSISTNIFVSLVVKTKKEKIYYNDMSKSAIYFAKASF